MWSSTLVLLLSLSLSTEARRTLRRSVEQITVVSKAMELLQNMHTKSLEAEAVIAGELATHQRTCQENEGSKTQELSELELQVQSLESEVAELQVQVGELQTSVLQHEQDVVSVRSQLEAARLGHTNQSSDFAQDLVEYNLAIAAVDRALLLLHTQQQQVSLLDMAAQDGASNHYLPDDGGMAKDEHIFDDLDSLSTAKVGYSGGSASAEGVLNSLKVRFENEKNAMMDKEQTNQETFHAEEKTLQDRVTTLQSTYEAEVAALSAAKGDLSTKEQELTNSRQDKASAEAFLLKLKQDCESQTKALEELASLHKEETQALNRAMELLVEQAGGGSSSSLGLLDVSPAPAPAAKATTAAQKALSLLRSRAQSLRSTELRKLLRQLGSLAHGHSQDSEDPLADVKILITELITRLQKESAEEASHKAWCDSELARNGEASSGAEADSSQHTAKVQQLEAEIAKLGLEVEQLNATLQDNEVQRQMLVQQRANQSNESAVAIADAEASASAVQAALSMLEEYFTNLTNALQPVQSISNFLPDPFRGAISMLEVARDGFRALVRETEAQSAVAEQQAVSTLQDLAVADVAAQKDRDFKQVQQQIYTTQLEQAQLDLNISKQELSEAEQAYEQLKPPCLNVQTREERMAQRESEIQALEEAYNMLENYEAEYSGGLSQPCFVQGKVWHTRGLISSLNTSSVPADAEEARLAGQVDSVKNLLTQMREDVAQDIAADLKVHEETECWCTDTVEQLQTSLARELDRDKELEMTVQMTTQTKAQLEAELERLQHELAQEQTALNQHTELRQRQLEEFREDEKELLLSTQQLSHALGLLRSRYEAAQEPAQNATVERERLTAEKEQLYAGTGLENQTGEDGAAALLRVAAEVQQALRSLPPQQARLAAQSTEASLALQDFLARPQDLIPLVSQGHHAALTEMEAVTSNPSMSQVLGVLEQLLETFKVDLQALREKEALDSSSATDLAGSKAAQINALENSISNKQSQLAVKMTENANAKSDLTYLRETRQADLQQLMDTQQHCAKMAQEFHLRDTARKSELQSLDEALALLAEGTPDTLQTNDAGSSNAAEAAEFLLRSPSGSGRVFRRPHSAQLPHTSAALAGRAAVTHFTAKGTSKVSVAATLRSSRQASGHRQQARPGQLSAAAATVPKPPLRASSGPVFRGHAGVARLRNSTAPPQRGKRRLAAVALHAHLGVARQPSGEALQASLLEAMKTVVSEIDKMYLALEDEGKLEVRMRDTCISEEHQATQQLERRKTEESGHNATLDRLTASISRMEPEISNLQAEIQALNSSMELMQAEVVQEYAKLKEAVTKQQAHQEKLRQAIEVLRRRYGSSAPSLMQGSPRGGTAFQVLQMNLRATNTTVQPSDPSLETPMPVVWQPPPTFSRPLRTHAGGMGIISILELLIHDSEEMVESLVRDEVAMSQDHAKALTGAQQAMVVKDRQLIELNQALGNANLERQEAESARAAVGEEQKQINAFLAVIASKCNTLLANFASNQELRAEDLRGLREARLALLVPAGGAAALQLPLQDHLASSTHGTKTTEPHLRGRSR